MTAPRLEMSLCWELAKPYSLWPNQGPLVKLPGAATRCRHTPPLRGWKGGAVSHALSPMADAVGVEPVCRKLSHGILSELIPTLQQVVAVSHVLETTEGASA